MPGSHSILLVDGDDATRRSLAHRLRQRGCHILEANGLEAAHRLAHRRRLDVALVDLDSLRDDGLQVVRALRSRRPACRIIVLVPSGMTYLSIRAMRLGAFDDQTHPVDVDLLLSGIRRALTARMRGGCTAPATNGIDVDAGGKG